MAHVRRWLSAAASLGLLVITLSGTLLPHQTEILRSLSPAASGSAADSSQVSLPQAVEVIKNRHPDEPVLSARWDTDVVEVRTEQGTYAIDPSTGHEISRASAAPVWVAVLDNLHRCLLSCRGPGHVHWMSQEIPHTGWWAGRRSLTVGGLVVATAGVVLVVLTISGLRTWWPLQRHRRTALSSHWRTQRLSRDTDLLKAAGLVLLPLLFLWGYYASAFSIRPTQPASPVSMTAHQSPAEPTSAGRAQDIGPHRAVAAALSTHRPVSPLAHPAPVPGHRSAQGGRAGPPSPAVPVGLLRQCVQHPPHPAGRTGLHDRIPVPGGTDQHGPGSGHRAASRRRRRAGGRRRTGGRSVPSSAGRPVVDLHGLGGSRRTAHPGAVPRRRRGERRPRDRADRVVHQARPPADHSGGLAPMTPMPAPEYVPVPTSQDGRRSGLWSQMTRRWGHNRTRTAPE